MLRGSVILPFLSLVAVSALLLYGTFLSSLFTAWFLSPAPNARPTHSFHARDASPQDLGFKVLNVTPNKATVLNSCPYRVYIKSVPAGGCPPGGESGWIEPGATWSEPASRCRTGNTSLKIYKSDTPIGGTSPDRDPNPPLQIEYGKDEATKVVEFYNLSFVDCVHPHGSPTATDVSACPGVEGGLQLVANGKCKAFACRGEDCCESGYCDPIGSVARAANDNIEPNSGCTVEEAGAGWEDLGIAVELCAGNRRG